MGIGAHRHRGLDPGKSTTYRFLSVYSFSMPLDDHRWIPSSDPALRGVDAPSGPGAPKGPCAWALRMGHRPK